MSTLKEKANEILAEKSEKIKPGNIRKGVKIFDVTGTLDSSGSGSKTKVPNFMRFDSSSVFSEFYGGFVDNPETGNYSYPKENWDSLINFYSSLDLSENIQRDKKFIQTLDLGEILN